MPSGYIELSLYHKGELVCCYSQLNFLNPLSLVVYSWYGLCEYLVVLTNIAFHTVEAIDFQNDYYISVAPPSRLKHN